MVKKVLSVMLLTVSIILSSQIADLRSAEAARDVYAYTEGGVEYYVTMYSTYTSTVFQAFVKGVQNGNVVKSLLYDFGQQEGTWLYVIRDRSNGAFLSKGRLSQNGNAQIVFDIVKSGKFDEASK